MWILGKRCATPKSRYKSTGGKRLISACGSRTSPQPFAPKWEESGSRSIVKGENSTTSACVCNLEHGRTSPP